MQKCPMKAWQHVWLCAQPCRLAGVSALVNGGSLFEKEALCQSSRWAGAAAAGRPCMIIMWVYNLQQCQNGHLALSCLWSGLFLSQQLMERYRDRQWALPSIHQDGKQQILQGLKAQETFLFLFGAPCESSQAEPLLFPLTCTG